MMRKKIIAGNWKMNMTPSEAVNLVNLLKDGCENALCDVVFCVPFVDIAAVTKELEGCKNIAVGAQNMHFENNGAYTGEVSADMLKELGVKYVILGHSERREYFGETDHMVNKKMKQALKRGLIPIVCVGESLEMKDEGITIDHIAIQIKRAFKKIDADDAKKVIIAYEPIWAIGTGRTASAYQAEEVCAGIRAIINDIYGDETAEAIRIQYGGSMNAENCESLLAMPDIDGGLIGGASLKADFNLITGCVKE
ncbi:MAG: triose-phosphate isomerase [Eubacterium sp.]|nr:triose-phosphate isomerase [Eubacterium sp.]